MQFQNGWTFKVTHTNTLNIHPNFFTDTLIPQTIKTVEANTKFEPRAYLETRLDGTVDDVDVAKIHVVLLI